MHLHLHHKPPSVLFFLEDDLKATKIFKGVSVLSRMERKGLSPVIATVLLIVLALILASIIFLWARSFLIEKAQKEGEPAENSCGSIQFEAEAYGAEVHIVNRGNVPLYSFEIKKKSSGTIEKVETVGGSEGSTIRNGETGSISLIGTSIQTSEEIIVTPIILGSIGSESKQYFCDGMSKTITVEM